MPNTLNPINKFPDRLRRAVLAGGGEFVGIQQGLGPAPDLLLFNSPTTGSTLAIPITDLLLVTFSDSEFSTRVREKIAESDKTFADRKVTVKASVLQDISKRLFELSEEIRNLQGRK